MGLLVAVRGGGHSAAGHGVCDQRGVVLDLSGLRNVQVQPEQRRAVVGGGARWAEVDVVTAAAGLAVTGGVISTTGVGGLTLGGGIGWLVRRAGPSCDNIVSATVVLADGSVVRVPDEDPELLWGLRGGGGAFGVVTSFELTLSPIPSGVLAGAWVYPVEQAARLLQAVAGAVDDLDRDLGVAVSFVSAPARPGVPNTLVGHRVAAVAYCHSGAVSSSERGVAALAALLPSPLARLGGRLPYPAWQSYSDDSAPAGLRNYWRGGYLSQVSASTASAVASAAALLPSPQSHLDVHLLGGAHGTPPSTGSAYGHRDAVMVYQALGTWVQDHDDVRCVEGVRAADDLVQATGVADRYLNYLPGDAAGDVAAAYATGTIERLRVLKDRVDPHNVFAFNHGVPGAARSS